MTRCMANCTIGRRRVLLIMIIVAFSKITYIRKVQRKIDSSAVGEKNERRTMSIRIRRSVFATRRSVHAVNIRAAREKGREGNETRRNPRMVSFKIWKWKTSMPPTKARIN